MATSTFFCPCCCSTANVCYQSWTAHWSCTDLAWTLTPGAKTCLPKSTSIAWSADTPSGDGCDYQRYVPMEKCCSVDSTCEALEETAPPAVPGNHDDCDCNPCLGDCGCRSVGLTATVTFADVENAMPCTKALGGAGSCSFAKAGSGTLGTYTLTRIPSEGGYFCAWYGQFEGITIKRASTFSTLGLPPGFDCDTDDCPPDEYFETIDGDPFFVQINLGFDPGTNTWGISVQFSEEEWLFYADGLAQGDCTEPLVFTNTYTAYDPFGFDSTGAVNINGTCTVTFAPCTPA